MVYHQDSSQKRNSQAHRLSHSAVSFLILLTLGLFLFGCSDTSMENAQTETQMLVTSTTGSRVSLPPTWTHTPFVTATLRPTFTPLPSRTPSPTLPLSAQIDGVKGQKMQMSLDCEANSAAIFARFFGVKINEIIFFNALPVSDNPHKGFVGDVHGDWGNLPPDSYGIYPGPVAAELQKYGVNAIAVYQFTLDSIKREIVAGEPVIVWVVGHVEHGNPLTYTSSDGFTSTIAPYEHTVIVIGYDQATISILDSDKIYTRSFADFLSSWGVLGNMAIIKLP